MKMKNVEILRWLVFGVFTLFLSGCVGSHSSVRKDEKEEILAGPESDRLLSQKPYDQAEKQEELVTFHLEIPGFPEWRRYYWTDRALWGNRGYILVGPQVELAVEPEAMRIFGGYEGIVEELRSKLTQVEQPRDMVVIIEQPIYDQRRAFEEIRLAEQTGLATEHDVRKGESLWLIAGYPEVYGNPLEWPNLYQANRDRIVDPNLIYPGQRIRIPRNINQFKV